MAQTIAIQRGTASLTFDNSTATTLFTQSGGTATRVIWGGLEASSGTTTTAVVIGVWILISGSTSNTIPVAIKSGSNGSSKGSLAMFPDGSTGQGMHSSWQTNTAPMQSSQTVLAGTGANSSYASGPNQYKVCNMSNNGDGSIQSCIYEAYPSNFWMGPSDVLVIKASGSGSGNVVYSFTTVTES